MRSGSKFRALGRQITKASRLAPLIAETREIIGRFCDEVLLGLTNETIVEAKKPPSPPEITPHVAAAEAIAISELEVVILASVKKGALDTIFQLFHQPVFDMERAEAVAYAKAKAAELIRKVSDEVRAKAKDVIVEGLSKGLPPDEVAEKLQEAFDGFTKGRAKVIAVTEMGRAYEAGAHGTAMSLYKPGVVDIVKSWLTAGDDRVEPHCAVNAMVGWILVNAEFPSGHTAPLAHPNCRCTLLYQAVTDPSMMTIWEDPAPVPPIGNIPMNLLAKAAEVKALHAKYDSMGEMIKAAKAAARPGMLATPVVKTADELTAEDILMTRVSGQSGSNPGGVYRGADGIERYVKFYSDPAQAWCENLANAIYRKVGVNAPESLVRVTKNGKTVFASKMLPDAVELRMHALTRDKADEILDGFVADVILGNWDVLGMNYDNIVMSGGKLFRIDNGGSLLFRAKAGRKTADVLMDDGEFWSFFSMNQQYRDVFDALQLTPESIPIERLKEQLRRFETVIDDIEWLVSVHAAGLSDADKAAVIASIKAKYERLTDRVARIVARREAMSAKRASADTLGEVFEEAKRKDTWGKKSALRLTAEEEDRLREELLAVKKRRGKEWTSDEAMFSLAGYVIKYKGSFYSVWNDELRKAALGATLTPEMEEVRDMINAVAMLSGGTTESRILYRGIRGSEGAKIIDEMVASGGATNASFCSASLLRNVADGWVFGRNENIIAILVEKGTPIISMQDIFHDAFYRPDNEAEWVLPAGGKLVFVGYHETPGWDDPVPLFKYVPDEGLLQKALQRAKAWLEKKYKRVLEEAVKQARRTPRMGWHGGHDGVGIIPVKLSPEEVKALLMTPGNAWQKGTVT